jgi:hypothetical protein
MRKFFFFIAVSVLCLAQADAALMNTFVLKPGGKKSLMGGDLRVCNDAESTSSATVGMRAGGMVYLQPGRCLNEWGMTLSFVNEGKGIVTIHYRSIAKNNGRLPGHHDF